LLQFFFSEIIGKMVYPFNRDSIFSFNVWGVKGFTI
jgi:hypothetical protein